MTTIKELIEHLSKYPEETRVLIPLVNSYECEGYYCVDLEATEYSANWNYESKDWVKDTTTIVLNAKDE